MSVKMLGAPDVLEKTNYKSVNSIRRLEREEGFPKRRKLGARVGWIESEVDEWLKARPVVEAT
jgi:predicted DNA-binding transcriptional regulator AlpA